MPGRSYTRVDRRPAESHAGFSLLELLVVITIMIVVAAICVPSLMGGFHR